jgi:glycosyltransferase involved in cell wall biosynthesis
MRIALIAPPWLPVPPPQYGGTERVVSTLALALQDRGHEVTIFTVGESTCPVSSMWLYKESQIENIGNAEISHAHSKAAYNALADWDVIHDHSMPNSFHINHPIPAKAIITNHNLFNQPGLYRFRRIAMNNPILAVSNHQASTANNLPIAAVIHNGINLDSVNMGNGMGQYVTHIGRMDPDKGVKEAILAARKVGIPLKIAAKMRNWREHDYYKEEVLPLLGGDIEYVGEVNEATKWELLRNSLALLNPISWSEPFGLIMAESLAAGTPVLATKMGAAPEIVQDGVNGFLTDSVEELADKIKCVESISRLACRASAEDNFSSTIMGAKHEQFYLKHLYWLTKTE